MKSTLHVLGLPHTQVSNRFVTCAYTAKAKKFCDMMTRQGWRVILYAGDESDTLAAEQVTCFTEAERIERFGEHDQNSAWGHVTWDPGDSAWRRLNTRAIAAIQERAKPRDFLIMATSHPQKPVADACPELLPIEAFVGYEGILPGFRVFESYAWMHYLYGKKGINDTVAYDTVINNWFDPTDFYVANKRGDARGEYLLFIGRLIARKGPHVAVDLAKRAGMRLIVAGPGGTVLGPGKIQGVDILIQGDHVEYVGPVDAEERARLMACATATLVPTLYVGPFEGVHVESLLSGTPVIVPDCGVFTETVTPTLGARYHILREADEGLRRVRDLDPYEIRKEAVNRWSLDAIGAQWTRHLERLQTLYGSGYYA